MSPVVLDPYRAVSNAPFSPLTSITWLAAYWASDPSWTNPGDGNPVSSWRDGSGNGFDVVQATGNRQPLYKATGFQGKPSVRGDGVNDYLQSAGSLVHAQPFTIVMISAFGKPAGARQEELLSSPGIAYPYRDVDDTAWHGYAGIEALPPLTSDTNPHLTVAYCHGGASQFDGDSYFAMDGTSHTGPTVSPGGNGINGAITTNGGGPGADAYASPGDLAFGGFYAGDFQSNSAYTAFKAWVTSYYGLTIA